MELESRERVKYPTRKARLYPGTLDQDFSPSLLFVVGSCAIHRTNCLVTFLILTHRISELQTHPPCIQTTKTSSHTVKCLLGVNWPWLRITAGEIKNISTVIRKYLNTNSNFTEQIYSVSMKLWWQMHSVENRKQGLAGPEFCKNLRKSAYLHVIFTCFSFFPPQKVTRKNRKYDFGWLAISHTFQNRSDKLIEEHCGIQSKKIKQEEGGISLRNVICLNK